MTSFRGAIVLVVAVGLIAAGCGDGDVAPADGGPELRIAVLQYGDVTDPIEVVSASSLGASLAIDQAIATGRLAEESDVSYIETAGIDLADVVAVARDVAADPTVIAAIVAPLTDVPGAERAFIEAGVPVFSFSGFGGVPNAPSWRRLVPTAAAEADALLDAAGPEPCVAGDAPGAPSVEARTIGGSASAVAAAAIDEGCSGLIWLGDADGALVLAAELDARDGQIGLVVTTPARVDRFAAEGFPHAVGTVAVVPCASVDVSTEPAARRFVHDYQARHGSAPGICAAEGYALATWLLSRGSRMGIAGGIAQTDRVAGPGGWLDLSSDPREPALERVVGVRWLPEA